MAEGAGECAELGHRQSAVAAAGVCIRGELRAQRDHLAGLLQGEQHWSFRSPPGGLALWLRLHRLTGQELAHRAQPHGLLIAPGQWFSPDGTLVHHVRLPFTATQDTLTRAVAILRPELREQPRRT